MSYRRTTWQEKLVDKPGYPKMLALQKCFPCYNALHMLGVEAGEIVVLVNPSEVIGVMSKVPEGKLITLKEICERIASAHGVKGCCTLTTGIFTMTAAKAVEEAAKKGNDLKIPYWRTLKMEGFLNEKSPKGAEGQKELLEAEGHEILNKGKKLFVKDYQRYLADI